MHIWNVAAIDIPVPDDLTSQEDRVEWYNYLGCLSPAQQLRKFAQGLDQFHQLVDKAGLSALPAQEQLAIYSKWEAVSAAAASLAKRLQFFDSEDFYYNKDCKSDVERTMIYVIDFLKSVNAPDVQAWEDRRLRLNQLESRQTPDGQDLLNSFLVQADRLVKKSAPGSFQP